MLHLALPAAPAVGAIIPLYIIARGLHLLDHVLLIILYTAINLPIAEWMLNGATAPT